MMEKSRVLRQSIAGFAATMSSFSAGFHYGWFSPSLPKLLADDSDVTITSDQSSWIMNFLTVGFAIGPFISMALVNRWGRKWALLFTSFPYLSSAILLAVAQNFWMFVLARFIAGLGVGISLSILPLYVGEIAEDKIRGALCTLIIVMMNVGTLVTYCIGPWTSLIALACFGGILPVLFVLMFLWMPESPYFLIMKQRPDQAKKSLFWLRGTTNVKEELNNIQDNIEKSENSSGTIKDLLVNRGNRKALVIVVGLALVQQFSGAGPILAYSILIFEASGSTINSSISVIIVGVTQVLSGVLTTFTVDLAGRRPLLMLSVGGLILLLVGEALYFQLLAAGIDVSSFAWLPITAIIGFIILYMVGIGCLPVIIFAEVMPINVKAPAMMILTLVSCSLSVIIMTVYQIVADSYGIHAAFWGFAVITVFSGIFIYIVVPETKQKSLIEIQDELHGNAGSSVA